MRIRRSSRLIITSPSSRVLLFHYSHKQGPLSGQDYWGTPGGGVEQGETIEDAGARELFEETGFVTSITDAPIEVRCNQITLPDGEHVLSEDSYFWIKTDSECIVGCGGCNFLSKLKAHGTRINSYLGIDKSETALTRAKSRLVGLKNYDLHKGDVSIIPAKDSSINTIIALGLLEHIDHVDPVLKEFYRVAASNCTLIVSTSNKRSFMYFARKFRQAFGLWPYGFQENDSLKTINRLIPFGFELKDAAILHGDNDHPLITAADKFASLFLKDWGRYILFYAAIKQGEK